MSVLTLDTLWTRKISPRRELRFALLAGMESCWVYTILAFLATAMRLPHLISPLAIFAAYWIALVVGRALPRRKERWVLLQAAAVTIAGITVVSVARFELYPEFALFDFAWLTQYVRTLFSFAAGLSIEHLAAAGVLFAFVRGLGFGQRPLTLWFTGFQFRLGIIIFFLLLMSASLFRRFDPAPWLFAYFFVSLLAIALARMEEMESDVSFGPRWAGTLVVSVLFVLFLGFVLLEFLTLDSLTSFLLLFAPLWGVVVGILVLITLPIAVVVGWVVDLLRPVFSVFDGLFQTLGRLIPPAAPENSRAVDAAGSLLAVIAPFLRPLFVLGVVLTAGYLIAGALNRRMKQSEEETYIRESLGEEKLSDRGGLTKKKRPAPSRAGHAAAESIRRIYAALVARAGEAGLPRALAETPYEYLPRLQGAWPDHAVDLRIITEAYVAVHYGEREFATSEVNRLRVMWKKLEQAIG